MKICGLIPMVIGVVAFVVYQTRNNIKLDWINVLLVWLIILGFGIGGAFLK